MHQGVICLFLHLHNLQELPAAQNNECAYTENGANSGGEVALTLCACLLSFILPFCCTSMRESKKPKERTRTQRARARLRAAYLFCGVVETFFFYKVLFFLNVCLTTTINKYLAGAQSTATTTNTTTRAKNVRMRTQKEPFVLPSECVFMSL